MESINFTIEDTTYTFKVERAQEFLKGKEKMLSSQETDITYTQPWYKKGYASFPFLKPEEFNHLKKGLTESVEQLIQQQLGKMTEGFDLSRYHHYVTSDEEHQTIVSKTRSLTPEDFNFSVAKIVTKLSNIIGFELTDYSRELDRRAPIIIRINRPQSSDYNPPHKDIYEMYDSELATIPPIVNLWIPISGVTERSALPVAPESHLIPENQIVRTRKGGMISGNNYRVRMIKEWAQDNRLKRAQVREGEVLFFSSHLIHGLAINDEPDMTRVALEFRLLRKGS